MRTVGEGFMVIGGVLVGRSLLMVAMDELARGLFAHSRPSRPPKDLLGLAGIGVAVVLVGLLLRAA